MPDFSTLKNPQWESRLYAARASFTLLVVVLLLGVLLWRYHDLQINRHQDFATLADNNRIHVRALPPARGLIYDRNGVLLADNRPGFTLSIVVERSKNLAQLLADIGELLAFKDTELARFEKLVKRRRPYESVPLRFNLSETEQAMIAVNEHRLSGVEVSAQLIRDYPLANQLAHVIGYTGRINERDLKRLDPHRYKGSHMTGKTGLEKYYEDQLLGEVGYENVETNARGRVMRVLERTDPVPGADLHLYLDSRLQKIAIDALGEERGAVVALDTVTGGVLALASMPSFDPNPFVTGISTKAYKALTGSLDQPLFDRALRGQYPPGSTIKPVFGLAALDSGTVTMGYRVYDPGYYQLENKKHKYRDWKRGGHGSKISIYDAIVQSCDVYFYDVGFRAGIDVLHDYGTRFGYGHKTGIDLPAEAPGLMPSRDWKQGARGRVWYPGDTINVSIGQGFMLATPLQMAVSVSRLATRGEVRKPRMVNAVGNELTAPVSEPASIDIPPRYWDIVIDAMAGVVGDLRGTARRAIGKIDYTMAGKTGTAQVVGIKQDEKYDASKLAKLQLDHALFIAFAPLENPRIAVAVIVENGEHGSSTAAPVARDVINAYFKYYPEPSTGELAEEAVAPGTVESSHESG
ncbi:MAG: penicillin-binding protein 2 [Gammaproteobacteria bacterium]|nr:penicillin-binding protein 2 [Gammaproteobacteria bacterium]MBQ0841060.1 penicillin-binding protein 2 [Gammaproteobacteria bacterium]